MRKVIGVVAGVLLANLLIFGSEYILPLTPVGAAVDMGRVAEPDFVASLPFAAQAWVVASWLLGAFAGAGVAFAVARWDYAGFVVAGLVAAAGIANVLMIPHPLWMRLAAIAAPFVGATLAFGAYRRWRATRLHLGR